MNWKQSLIVKNQQKQFFPWTSHPPTGTSVIKTRKPGRLMFKLGLGAKVLPAIKEVMVWAEVPQKTPHRGQGDSAGAWLRERAPPVDQNSTQELPEGHREGAAPHRGQFTQKPLETSPSQLYQLPSGLCAKPSAEWCYFCLATKRYYQWTGPKDARQSTSLKTKRIVWDLPKDQDNASHCSPFQCRLFYSHWSYFCL